MKAILDCTTTKNALKKVLAITSAETVNLLIKEKTAEIVASGNDTVVQVSVPVEAEGETKFTSNIRLLIGIMEGRSSVTIEHSSKESQLSFYGSKKGSTYKGNIVLLPYAKIKVSSIEEGIKFKEEQHKALVEALRQVKLNDVYGGSMMYLFIRGNKKKLVVACFDNMHVAYHTNTSIKFKRDIDVSFPIQVFETINTLAGNSSYLISVDENNIVVQNKDFIGNFPSMQSTSELKLDTVTEYVKSLPKIPESKVSLNINRIKAFITNASSLYEEKHSLVLNGGKKSVAMQVETSFGDLEESIKIDGVWKNKVKCNPLLLMDLLSNVNLKDIELCDFNKSALFFHVGNSDMKTTYICSTTQDE